MTEPLHPAAKTGAGPSARLPASPEPLAGASAPPSQFLLDRVEEVLEIRLPRAYRQFLARGNGGAPKVSRFVDASTGELAEVEAFYPLDPGAPDGVFAVLQKHGDRLPPGTLPIARGSSSNVLLLGLDEPWGNQALLWDTASEPLGDPRGNLTWVNVHPVATDFADLLGRFVAD